MDKLKTWFWDKFNSCYLVKHEDYPESIFMYYDPQYVRKMKLAKISGEEIYKNNITGLCLFEQDWKNKWFYCNFVEIWDYLYDNYSKNYTDAEQFITDRLEEHTKMSVLTPVTDFFDKYKALEEHTKMSVLTPCMFVSIKKAKLEEHTTKMSVLTPLSINMLKGSRLEEHTKMSVLTPAKFLCPTHPQLEEHTKMSVLTPVWFDKIGGTYQNNTNCS